MSKKKTGGLAAFRLGVHLGAPVILGYIPAGIAYALIARQAGFSVLETCLMSAFVHAGASQMMAVGMSAQGAGVAAILLTTFILNLRYFIMSACVMNDLKREKRPFKMLLAFGVTDEVFAIHAVQKRTEHPGMVFLGMSLVSYLACNLGTFIGAVASDFLPPLLTAALGIAMYAMFIALLMPSLHGNGRLALLVVFTAAINALLSRLLTPGWALVVATLVGAAVGVPFVELPGKELYHED